MAKVFNRDVEVFGDVTVSGAAKPATLTLTDTGTATASSGAATLSTKTGVVTTESLTTAQNAIYTLTLTNTKIAATSVVLVSVGNGTNTQGTPMLGAVTPAAGSCVIKVINKHATAEALNGTLKIAFAVIDVA